MNSKSHLMPRYLYIFLYFTSCNCDLPLSTSNQLIHFTQRCMYIFSNTTAAKSLGSWSLAIDCLAIL